MDTGDGDAVRIGRGAGHAEHTSIGDGDSIRDGDGPGNAYGDRTARIRETLTGGRPRKPGSSRDLTRRSIWSRHHPAGGDGARRRRQEDEREPGRWAAG